MPVYDWGDDDSVVDFLCQLLSKDARRRWLLYFDRREPGRRERLLEKLHEIAAKRG